MSMLFEFEESLKTLQKFEKPYRNSVLHYDEKIVISQLKKIKRILDDTIKEIDKQALQGGS